MKVFAPKRILPISDYLVDKTRGRCSCGVPLEGDWIDKDDYFRQVSSGNEINDVVHAKVVDAAGFEYSCCDLRDETGHIFYANAVTGSGTSARLYSHCASYENRPIKVWRLPRNYKGKKPLEPRLYDDVVRVSHSALILIRAYTMWYKIAPSIEVYYTCEGTKPKAGMEYYRSSTVRVNYHPTGNQYYPKGYSLSGDAAPYFQGLKSTAESLVNIDAKGNRLNDDQVKLLFDTFLPAVKSELFSFLDTVAREPSVTGSKPRWIVSSEIDYFDHPELAFILDEPEIYGNRLDPILLGKDVKFHNYWRNYLTQHALLAACESFPKLNDNSISNIIEVVGFIKALVIDHRIEMPKSLSDAWLAYRYQYSTSKMDIKEAVKFVRRYRNLGTLARTISCHGICSQEIEDTTVTCRCSIDITPKDVGYLDRILRALDTFGLTPDFYVVWDMIPYSFIADWFLPISDILETFDADSKYFSGEFYSLTNLCYSLSYTRDLVTEDGSTVKCKCYTRWKGSVPSSLNSLYWLDAPSASSRTVQFRIIDAASLFIGR